MAIIRGTIDRLTPDRRSQLVTDLQRAVEHPSPGEPVIFEIPFAGTRFDIMAVWDKWKDVQPDERAEIISEVYSARHVEIGQAMGVTYGEAMQDHLLPYQIHPCARTGEVDPAKLREAMLQEGAISLGEGNIDLRFPTGRMADVVRDRLDERMPEGHWTVAIEGATAMENYYH
jgi:hypothetical protein